MLPFIQFSICGYISARRWWFNDTTNDWKCHQRRKVTLIFGLRMQNLFYILSFKSSFLLMNADFASVIKYFRELWECPKHTHLRFLSFIFTKQLVLIIESLIYTNSNAWVCLTGCIHYPLLKTFNEIKALFDMSWVIKAIIQIGK